VWLNILALFFSLLAASSSVYIFLSLSRKLERSDIVREIEGASKDIGKIHERQIKEIESEWDNMYQKFSALAGRMDRKKALTPAAPEPVAESPRSRSELLKRRRENV